MENKAKPKLIGLIIYIIILGIAVPVGILTDTFSIEQIKNIVIDLSVIIKLVIMIAGVLAVTNLLNLLLSLPKPKNHRTRSLLTIFCSLIKYVAGVVILCWGLSIIGVNISTIVASVGIVALIIGFSAESLIADVVTGAFMIFENQYNVGDIVEVDGFRGIVTNIGIRTTRITDTGDNVKIINNSAMKNILNRSDKLSRSVSDICIPYNTDLENLESQLPNLMNDIYVQQSETFKAPPRYLGVQSLSDSAVVLRFVADVDEKDIFSGTRILNHDLLLGFRKLGVECPFPQLDVHMDKDVKPDNNDSSEE